MQREKLYDLQTNVYFYFQKKTNYNTYDRFSLSRKPIAKNLELFLNIKSTQIK